jgi:hypothetical protein
MGTRKDVKKQRQSGRKRGTMEEGKEGRKEGKKGKPKVSVVTYLR